jgi:hypothetical protein
MNCRMVGSKVETESEVSGVCEDDRRHVGVVLLRWTRCDKSRSMHHRYAGDYKRAM